MDEPLWRRTSQTGLDGAAHQQAAAPFSTRPTSHHEHIPCCTGIPQQRLKLQASRLVLGSATASVSLKKNNSQHAWQRHMTHFCFM